MSATTLSTTHPSPVDTPRTGFLADTFNVMNRELKPV